MRLALIAVTGTMPVGAQTWQTETSPPARPGSAPQPPTMGTELPLNTTIVPRAPAEGRAVGAGGPGLVTLQALLSEEGQGVEQGLVWRIFRDKPGPNGKPLLIATHRETTPTLRLDPGTYVINVGFGRANLTRTIVVASEKNAVERFVLNAGGLRVLATLTSGEQINERAVSYDIYSDERDQYGQRVRVTSGMKPGMVVRLNSGIYNILSSYGDANATARADVTVEAGKLTEAVISHAAGKVTFKLVARAGGDAVPDTQWSLANLQGEIVKESAGALPTHILAPGDYTVSAKNAGEVFQRTFRLRAGDTVQVEIVRP
jgi:hypothetical protein